MDERGVAGDPFRAALVLILGLLVFILLVAYFTAPLESIWRTTEEMKPEGAPDVWSGLRHAWMLIPVAVVGLVVVWFFARLFQREREVEYIG